MIIVLICFLIILALVCAVIYFLVRSISGSFGNLIANAPTIITNGLNTFQGWLHSQIKNYSPELQKQVNDTFATIGSAIGSWLQGAFTTGLSFIFSTVTFLLGFFTLPFFLIFFMANIRELGKGFFSLFSEEIIYHIRNFLKIMDRVFGRYFRAQILIGIIMGIVVTVTLYLLRVPLAPALGIIAGAFQLIPTIGGAIAAVIGIIVTLAVAPGQIIWVIIAYVLINIVLGTILIAKLSGNAVNIDPSVIMILIVVGGFLGGVLGMIIIVAMLYALYKYVREEMKRTELAIPEKN